MRAKIFLDHILLNLDIKTQITCNYHTETERAPNETWPIMPIFCVVGAGMCSIVTDALNMHRPISTVVHYNTI